MEDQLSHDPRWPYFVETVLKVRGASGEVLEIDLRDPPAPGLGADLARLGLDGPFAVITAYHPFGEDLDEEENRRRDRELRARPKGEHEDTGEARTLIQVDGRSPDGSYCEPGWGIQIRLEEACALARDFGQTAIYWWDGESFWLIEAREGGERVRM